MRFAKASGSRKEILGKEWRNQIGRGKRDGAERKPSGGVGAGQGLRAGVRAGKETDQQAEEQVQSGKDGLGKWQKGKGELAI